MSSTSSLNLRDFFDHVWVINLKRRSDRLEEFRGLWAPYCEPLPDTFDAYDGWVLTEVGTIPPNFWGMVAPGFAGSWMSHQLLATQTPEDQSVLIFEDDAVPAVDFAPRVAAMMEQMPDDWEGIFLGWAPGHGHVLPLDKNLVRHRAPLNTHAYALRGNLLRFVKEQKPEHWGRSHWDGMICHSAKNFNVYGPRDGTLVSQANWTGKIDPSDNYKDHRRVQENP